MKQSLRVMKKIGKFPTFPRLEKQRIEGCHQLPYGGAGRPGEEDGGRHRATSAEPLAQAQVKHQRTKNRRLFQHG